MAGDQDQGTEVKTLQQQMNTGFEDMKKFLAEQLKQMVDNATTSITNSLMNLINTKMEEVEGKIVDQLDSMAVTIAELEKKVKFLEEEKHQKNIVIHGMEIQDRKNKYTDIENIIHNVMGLNNIRVQNVIFLKSRNSTSPPPIIIQLSGRRDVIEILRNGKKLKDFKVKDRTISFREDLSKEKRIVKSKLMEKVKSLKQEGAREVKFLSYSAAKVDGVIYTSDGSRVTTNMD
jgi:hypothetical protein